MMKKEVELTYRLVVKVISLAMCQGLHAAITISEHPYPPDGSGFYSVGAGTGSDSGVIYDNRIAQTFLAATTGYIESLTFYAYRFGYSSMDADLRVSVTEILGGQPGNVLVSAYVPFSSISIGSPLLEHLRDGSAAIRIVFSATTLLESGVTYALVFSSDTPEANYRMIGHSGLITADNYLGGEQLRSQNGSLYIGNFGADLNFSVEAAPIPEHGVPGMFCAAAVAAMFLRKRSALPIR